jgi:nucleoid DNA-binding protein
LGGPPPPAQSAPRQVRLEIPPGWTVFRGPSGLIVPHPAGWNVQERGDGGFAAFCPGQDGGAIAVVYVQPIAKIEGRAASVALGLGQIAPELFPGVRVARMRIVSSEPDVAVGELSFTARAAKFIGAALCFKTDPQGVLYAIAATQEAWPQGEAVMKQVLSRFFYAGKGGPAAGPPMVAWRDPIEGAFTCPVPQGWKVEGGMRRFGLADVRSEILATSPDDSMLVRIGDAAIPSLMSVPTAFGAQYGFQEGGVETNGFGTRMPILRYLPATDYLTQVYLPQRVGQVSNLKVQNQPQTAGQAYGMTILRDEGYVTFDAQTGAGLRKGGAYIRTGFMPSSAIPNGGTWSVELFYGYLAAPEAEPRVEAILPPMVAGYKVDPVWSARQKEAMAKVHGSVLQAQRETFNIINQAYADRSASQDRMFGNWSRAFRGEVLIQDPTTGETFEVPAGSNYYFRVGADNTFVGTDTATPPDLPNHWLKEMRIGN